MSDKTKELDAAGFNDFILGGLVVVDFYADWCVPCRQMAAYVDKLAEEYSGRIAFGMVNIDRMPDIAAHWQVMSIPMLMAFKDGKKFDKIIGENHTAIERMLEKLVK